MATLTLHDDPLPMKLDEHGRVGVGGTRVFLSILVADYHNGMSAEDMARAYPTLKAADVYTSLGYYLRHREEVDEYLRELDREADAIRAKFEAQFPPKVSREELRARQDALRQKQGR